MQLFSRQTTHYLLALAGELMEQLRELSNPHINRVGVAGRCEGDRRHAGDLQRAVSGDVPQAGADVRDGGDGDRRVATGRSGDVEWVCC